MRDNIPKFLLILDVILEMWSDQVRNWSTRIPKIFVEDTFGISTLLMCSAGKVFLYIYLSDTSPAPEKPGKYLKKPFRHLRGIYTHFSGAGKVLIYTYLAPEKSEKYLYAPINTACF